jgi:hypothetical protein
MDHEKIVVKEVVGALEPACASGPSTFTVGFSKNMIGARVPIFGHAAHDPFAFASAGFVDVPNTYSSSYSGFRGRCRLEVVFATNHDQSIEIRMFDPANPSLHLPGCLNLREVMLLIHGGTFRLPVDFLSPGKIHGPDKVLFR